MYYLIFISYILLLETCIHFSFIIKLFKYIIFYDRSTILATKSYHYSDTIYCATKILFIGNMNVNITDEVLKRRFGIFGDIIVCDQTLNYYLFLNRKYVIIYFTIYRILK